MIHKCVICGKEFEVLWSHLWRYKRRLDFCCSWKCLRRMDAEEEIRKEATNMKTLTEDEKRFAITMALNDENPLPYLKEIGCKNPSTAWATVRKWAEKEMPPEKSALLPETFGKKKERPKVELVYDPEIAEEYKREQAQKEANTRARAEAKKKDDAPKKNAVDMIKEEKPLEVAAVYSRVLKDGTYKKIHLDGEIGMALCGMNMDIMLTANEWLDLAKEIGQAVVQMYEG